MSEVAALPVKSNATAAPENAGAGDAVGWSAWPTKQRIKCIAKLRRELATNPQPWLAALQEVRGRQNDAESLAAEILPLAAACAWLEREGPGLLRPVHHGACGRAWWLWGVRTVLHREPRGNVLIIGPGNFPLFLPGVQVIQALAAGNVVLLKPAPQGRAVASLLVNTLHHFGVPAEALVLLADSVAEVERVLPRADHVILTGSEATGQAVQQLLHERGKPGVTATYELSGCDAAVILPGADLKLVARTLAFGLMLNGGATCIAPRRIFVPAESHDALLVELSGALVHAPAVEIAPAAQRLLQEVVRDALDLGAELHLGESLVTDPVGPLILTQVPRDAAVLDADVFAPVLSVLPYNTTAEAVRQVNTSGYRLGASVFGPVKQAQALARQLDVGCVTVNDLIVPTADARLPFVGRGRSGHGATRGAAGLLELTRLKAVATRRGSARPHLRATDDFTRPMLEAVLQVTYGRGPRQRTAAGFRLLKLFRLQTTARRTAANPPKDVA